MMMIIEIEKKTHKGRSIINKKSDGSQVKESTDSSNTTLEDEDTKGVYHSI